MSLTGFLCTIARLSPVALRGIKPCIVLLTTFRRKICVPYKMNRVSVNFSKCFSEMNWMNGGYLDHLDRRIIMDGCSEWSYFRRNDSVNGNPNVLKRPKCWSSIRVDVLQKPAENEGLMPSRFKNSTHLKVQMQSGNAHRALIWEGVSKHLPSGDVTPRRLHYKIFSLGSERYAEILSNCQWCAAQSWPVDTVHNDRNRKFLIF